MKYVQWKDRFRSTPLGYTLLDAPCYLDEGETSSAAMLNLQSDYLHSPECISYSPMRNYRGIWQFGFETSAFLELGQAPYSPELLSRFSQQKLPSLYASKSLFDGLAPYEETSTTNYLIEFRGRLTKVAGSYGHMGLKDHEIWVDDILSIEPLPVLESNEMDLPPGTPPSIPQ